MTNERSNEAEQILRELEKEILERIEATETSTSAPKMDSSVGRLTYMDAYQSQQVALHGRRQLEARLVTIRNALKRVAAGTYGICPACEQPIPAERLEYMPDAPYCVTCKERLGF